MKINMKNLILFGIFSLMILFGGIIIHQSYALFTVDEFTKSSITIKVGTMIPILKVDGVVQNSLTIEKGASKTFIVTVENNEDVSGKFLLYYQGILPSGVTFGYLEEEGMNVPREAVLATKGKHTYSLYVNNQSSKSISISIQAIGGLSNQTLSLPSNGKYIEKTTKEITYSNPFMSKVYQYDQTTGSKTFCVTGEESTCVQIASLATYPPGTIIKYKVNSSEEKYFHVISDNGNTLTLQQRENLFAASIGWTSQSNNGNKKGPTSVLPTVESSTSNWTNVLDQTYTPGVTVFKNNPYTGCDPINSCTTNTYTLAKRTAKARMITAQEAVSLGCSGSPKSCPIWMYNYLSNSTSYGGTVNQGSNTAYWTMNAYSTTTSYAWAIGNSGKGSEEQIQSTNITARAVVVIQK